MAIKRYDPGCAYAGEEEMILSSGGDYVSYEDYAELQRKLEALAVEGAKLKSAFDKPQAYLSWHSIPTTWDDPLPCGEYLDVHGEPGHKNSDGTECWPVFTRTEIETPATDTALADIHDRLINDAISAISESGAQTVGGAIVAVASMRKDVGNEY